MTDHIRARQAAIELAGHCFAVFPLQADKRPFPGSHGCLDATTEPDDILSLWMQYPGVLVGVATGLASHLLVVDLDAKHAGAHDFWKAYKPVLMPTRVHRTRSGGFHLLYADGDGIIRNSASKIAPGVDIRGAGGYIVWWPAAGQPVLCDAEPAPIPDVIGEMLAPPKVQARIAHVTEHLSVARGDARAKLTGIFDFLGAARDGERNQSLFWAAKRITEMMDEAEINEVDGRLALSELADIAHGIGLKSPEIIRTIKSAAR